MYHALLSGCRLHGLPLPMRYLRVHAEKCNTERHNFVKKTEKGDVKKVTKKVTDLFSKKVTEKGDRFIFVAKKGNKNMGNTPAQIVMQHLSILLLLSQDDCRVLRR